MNLTSKHQIGRNKSFFSKGEKYNVKLPGLNKDF